MAAKYHRTALDIWGQDANRICQDGDGDYLNLHEVVALAYAFYYYYSAVVLIPSAEETIKPILESLGLPTALLDTESPDPSTPWGLVKMAVNEMSASVMDDGWNAKGKLTAEFIPLPYSDFSTMGGNGYGSL